MQGRKEDVVKKLTNGVQSLLTKNKVTKIEGVAEAVNESTIKVGKDIYTCENLVIATGSEPNNLPIKGAKEAIESGFMINSTSGLSLPKIPKKMVIIGGGVIGVEFACLYKRLGTEVTILQGLPTILEMLDSDLSKTMTKELIDNTIKIITNVNVKEVQKGSIKFELNGKIETIKCDYVLQSVGRHAITTGFEKIDLKIDEKGYIPINEYCETNNKRIFAIGDVTGKMMLAHVASHEGVIAAQRMARYKNLDHEEDFKMDFNKVPSCIYTHPEVASVGKTEDELKKSNTPYKAYKFPFAAIGKAMADGNTTGFVKLIIEPKYKSIIGAHIVCDTATDMISEITTVMECEGTISEVARAIHPHPTLSEAIGEAAEALESGKPINF